MYYGHGSWVIVLVVVAMVAMRSMSARRGGPRRGPAGRAPSAQPWRSGFGPAPGTSPPVEHPGAASPAYTGIPAGWMTDPSGRYEERYWSGTEWSEHVRTGGVPATDAPPGRAAGAAERPDGPAPGDGAPPGDAPL